jgi:hypothetical protein
VPESTTFAAFNIEGVDLTDTADGIGKPRE